MRRYFRKIRRRWKPVALAAAAILGSWFVIAYEPPPPPDWRPIKAVAPPAAVEPTKPQEPRRPAINVVAARDVPIANAELPAAPISPPSESLRIWESMGDVPDGPAIASPPGDEERIVVASEADVDEGEAASTEPVLPLEPVNIVALPDLRLPLLAPGDREHVIPQEPPPADAAYVTIIIDDLGLNSTTTERLVGVPGPLTFAFLPYGYNLDEQSRAAAQGGHEIFVHLPMEPKGPQDPGPDAIVDGMGEEQVREITREAIVKIQGAVGVNNHMGSRATADATLLRPIMDELREAGLVFVDSMTTAGSVAGTIAREAGVPASRRDIFLDNDPTPAAIHRQLRRLEQQALLTGTAIGIGHPYPATLAALEVWTQNLAERGIQLIPASKMIAYRLCEGDMWCDPRSSLVAQRDDVVSGTCDRDYC